MTEKLISIVIPLYNEKDSLAELHDRISRVMETRDERVEIIFVDDGSNDGSAEEILRLRSIDSRIGLVRHRINHGKSMALMQGFYLAKGDFAISLDADLQDEPEHIPLFLKQLENGFDLVNGNRKSRKDSLIRKWLSVVFNKITNSFLQSGVSDINCGFKGYSKLLYKRLRLRGDLHRLTPAIARMMGCKVCEVAISHSPRKHGFSKYRAFRHRGILDIISLQASWATQFRPFHVFSELSVLFWLAAALSGGIWLLVYTGLDDTVRLHSALNILVLLFFSWCVFLGTLLPIVGFILEQMTSSTQDETWRRQLVEVVLMPDQEDLLHEED